MAARGAFKKSFLFGAMGAMGCLIAAVAGELLLGATRPEAPKPPPAPPRAVCLLIDCSESMAGQKFREVKSAAGQFARRRDLDRDSVAVVGFGSAVHLGIGLTGDLRTIEQAIVGLPQSGFTFMDLGLQAAIKQIKKAPGERNILMFTDGVATAPGAALTVADTCRRNGIRIVVGATGDADVDYLSALTGDSSLVLWADTGDFDDLFRTAETIIFEPTPTPIETSSTAFSFQAAMLRIGGWNALLAVGIFLALVVGQNRYLRRRRLTALQAIVGVPSSLLAGFAAGAAGQFVYVGLAHLSAVETLGRAVAWTFLGVMLGWGVAFVVPNLKHRRALVAGGLGGAVAAGGFLWAAGALGDVAGRLSAAAALGLSIGLAVALVETVFRRAWLEVSYGPRDIITVNLGSETVAIGSDRKACTVHVPNVLPVAFRFKVAQGRVLCQDVRTRKAGSVPAGHQMIIGDVIVTVHVAGGASQPPATGNPQARAAPPRGVDRQPRSRARVT